MGAELPEGVPALSLAPIKFKRTTHRRIRQQGKNTYTRPDEIVELIKIGRRFQVTETSSGIDVTKWIIAQAIAAASYETLDDAFFEKAMRYIR